jgi:OOP family OmpA-OmpF porin
MKKFFMFTVFLVVMSAVTAVQAEVRAGSFSVTPFAGGYFFEGNQNIKDSYTIGLRAGYNLTKNLGVEGFFSYVPTRFKDPDDKNEVYVCGIEGIYHFLSEGPFVPFVAIGVGAFHYSDGRSRFEPTNFAVDYGAGVKYFIMDDIALRADVRHVIPFNDRYNDLLCTFGIEFAFGGQKKEVVATSAEEPAAPVETIVAAAPPEPEKVVILASEPQVEEKVMVAAAEPKIIVLAFEDVHFDFDKSTLKPEAQTILKRNIQLLKDNPKAQVRIAGYTSASGTDEYNQKLSERRANAVQEYLVNEGIISPDRLSTIGYGETNPAMYEAAPKELYSTAAKANMRVLFEIVVQGGSKQAPVAAEEPAAPVEEVAPVAEVAVAPPATVNSVPVDNTQIETKSTSEENIKNLVTKWLNSWRSGDMKTYRSCYTSNFESKGKDLNGWITYKTNVRKRSKNINIDIDDLQISVYVNGATAVFTQSYSSSILKDKGKKTLELRKENDEWKIYREVM